MTDKQYLELLNQIGWIRIKYRNVDVRDVLHNVMIAQNDPTQSVNLNFNKIAHMLAMENRQVCCGGSSDIEPTLLRIKHSKPPTKYQYCYDCNQVLPEGEFREISPGYSGHPYRAKVCRICENRKDSGRKRESKNKKQNSKKSVQKSRNNLTDGYIIDILKKNKVQVTPEAIILKRESIIELRKKRYTKKTGKILK